MHRSRLVIKIRRRLIHLSYLACLATVLRCTDGSIETDSESGSTSKSSVDSEESETGEETNKESESDQDDGSNQTNNSDESSDSDESGGDHDNTSAAESDSSTNDDDDNDNNDDDSSSTSDEDSSSGEESSDSSDTGNDNDDDDDDELPFDPLYRIDLRIHVADSDLSEDQLRPILTEMNEIWLKQAAVCFEIEVVRHEDIRNDGFDFWYIRNDDPRVSDFNGVYRGDHDILSRDEPRLGNVDTPVMYNAARTGAHELGHGLTLRHTNEADPWGEKHRENLMASGTKGWHIPAEPADPKDQALKARKRAKEKALPDNGKQRCGEPTFE